MACNYRPSSVQEFVRSDDVTRERIGEGIARRAFERQQPAAQMPRYSDDELIARFQLRGGQVEVHIRGIAAQLTAVERERDDLRNRLNWSEKLQGRFPVDAVQPTPAAQVRPDPYGIKKLRRAFEISQEPRTGMHVGLPHVTIEASLVAHSLKSYDDLQQQLAKAQDTLRAIGDRAHDLSTGPAVPDGYWELREMAYGN